MRYLAWARCYLFRDLSPHRQALGFRQTRDRLHRHRKATLVLKSSAAFRTLLRRPHAASVGSASLLDLC